MTGRQRDGRLDDEGMLPPDDGDRMAGEKESWGKKNVRLKSATISPVLGFRA
jgi:hypothetical protein